MTEYELYDAFKERVQQDVNNGLISESDAVELCDYAYDNYICEKGSKLDLKDKYRLEFENIEKQHNKNIDSIHDYYKDQRKTKIGRKPGVQTSVRSNFSPNKSAGLTNDLNAETRDYNSKINNLNKKYTKKETLASIPKPSKLTIAAAATVGAGYGLYRGGKAIITNKKNTKEKTKEDVIERAISDPEYAITYLTKTVLPSITKCVKRNIGKNIALDYTAGKVLNNVTFSGRGKNRNKAEAEMVANSMNKSNAAINELVKIAQDIANINTPAEASRYVKTHQALLRKLMK